MCLLCAIGTLAAVIPLEAEINGAQVSVQYLGPTADAIADAMDGPAEAMEATANAMGRAAHLLQQAAASMPTEIAVAYQE